MYVPASPHKITNSHVQLMSHHLNQQRIGSDVERHAEERIRTQYVQVWSLATPRHENMTATGYPRSSDYITISILGDPSRFELT